MILTVLVLSSAVLALSAIGGYMMLVRLRISSDIVNTTKAIYIADAGLECEAYNRFGPNEDGFCNANGRNSFLYTGTVADPGAAYEVTYTDVPSPFILSKGNYRSSGRSFRLDFNF